MTQGTYDQILGVIWIAFIIQEWLKYDEASVCQQFSCVVYKEWLLGGTALHVFSGHSAQTKGCLGRSRSALSECSFLVFHNFAFSGPFSSIYVWHLSSELVDWWAMKYGIVCWKAERSSCLSHLLLLSLQWNGRRTWRTDKTLLAPDPVPVLIQRNSVCSSWYAMGHHIRTLLWLPNHQYLS